MCDWHNHIELAILFSYDYWGSVEKSHFCVLRRCTVQTHFEFNTISLKYCYLTLVSCHIILIVWEIVHLSTVKLSTTNLQFVQNYTNKTNFVPYKNPWQYFKKILFSPPKILVLIFLSLEIFCNILNAFQ